MAFCRKQLVIAMSINKPKNKSRGLPDFMIIGAAKSGTTSLFHSLIRHPKIFIPDMKEPEYFSRQSINNRGLDWYRSLFAPAQDGQLCADASTTYTRWPHTLDAPALIAELLPDIKFIYIMRHPIDRAYSHYGHHMRKGVTMTFEEALEKDDIYLDCSRYMFQIERYLRFFDREQFLFLFFDDLKQNADNLLTAILNFLDLKAADLTEKDIPKSNQGGADHYIRHQTTKKLRQVPGIGPLAGLLPQRLKDAIFAAIKSSSLGQLLAEKAKLPPMLPDTRRTLIEYFKGENSALENFLDVNLDSWRI